MCTVGEGRIATCKLKSNYLLTYAYRNNSISELKKIQGRTRLSAPTDTWIILWANPEHEEHWALQSWVTSQGHEVALLEMSASHSHTPRVQDWHTAEKEGRGHETEGGEIKRESLEIKAAPNSHLTESLFSVLLFDAVENHKLSQEKVLYLTKGRSWTQPSYQAGEIKMREIYFKIEILGIL